MLTTQTNKKTALDFHNSETIVCDLPKPGTQEHPVVSTDPWLLTTSRAEWLGAAQLAGVHLCPQREAIAP